MVRRRSIFRFQLALVLLVAAGCSGNYQEKVIGRLLDYSEQSRQDPFVQSQLMALGMSSTESINAVARARPLSEKDAKTELLKLCWYVDQEVGEVVCEPEAAELILGLHGMKQKLGRGGKVLLQELRVSRGGEGVSGVAAVAIDSQGERQRVVQVFSNGAISKGLPYGDKNLAEVLPKELSSVEIARLSTSGDQLADPLVCPFGRTAVDSSVFERFNRQVLKPLLQEKKSAWLEAKPGKGCVQVSLQVSHELKLAQLWQEWVAGQRKETSEGNPSISSILATGNMNDSQVYLLPDSTKDGQQEKKKIEKLERENQGLTTQIDDLTKENEEQTERRRTANARVFELEQQQCERQVNDQPEVRNNRRLVRRNSVTIMPRVHQLQQDDIGNGPCRRRNSVSANNMDHGGGNLSQELQIIQLRFKLRELQGKNERLLAEVESKENRNQQLTGEWKKARRFLSVITRETRNLENLRSALDDSLQSANKQIVDYKRELDKKERILKEKNVQKSLYRISCLIANIKSMGSAKVRKAIMKHADNFPEIRYEDRINLVKNLIKVHRYKSKEIDGREIGKVIAFLFQVPGEIETHFLNKLDEEEKEAIWNIIPKDPFKLPENKRLKEKQPINVMILDEQVSDD